MLSRKKRNPNIIFKLIIIGQPLLRIDASLVYILNDIKYKKGR
jgi:hypothetical protein